MEMALEGTGVVDLVSRDTAAIGDVATIGLE